jgi:hypothetical protein
MAEIALPQIIATAYDGAMQRRTSVYSVIALLACAPADAARVLYLARAERLCDAERTACVDGTLTYRVNSRVLWLNGRLGTSPGPGAFVITLTGATRLGIVRYAPMEISLRGHSSEIVNFKMVPDDPDVYDWQIHRIEFIPERPDKN